MLTESYPDPKEGCKNGGQLQDISQKVYMCSFKSKPNDKIRVTKESYQIMKTEPYYIKRADCNETNVQNKVCVCPSGFSGSLCGT